MQQPAKTLPPVPQSRWGTGQASFCLGAFTYAVALLRVCLPTVTPVQLRHMLPVLAQMPFLQGAYLVVIYSNNNAS